MIPSSGSTLSSLRHGNARLEVMYQISKLLTSFDCIETTSDAALGLLASTLPLRSAVLIVTEDSRSHMIVWRRAGQTVAHMRSVKERCKKTYAYLIGATADDRLEIGEQAGASALPKHGNSDEIVNERYIVAPLVVAHQPLFGCLQLEGAQAFEEMDLMFVNAIANQLSIAFDRDHARRRELVRREYAEGLAVENARLYEEAKQAVLVREHLLAVVSHDLRNPLGAILLTAEVLAMKPEVSAQAARITRAANRMLRLIEDLLDFASIETGSFSMKRSLQDPGAIALELQTNFEAIAHEKKVALVVSMVPHLPQVSCDRDRILQVLTNIVSNAIKSTPRGGRVKVGVQALATDVLFSVTDTGSGISKDDVAHLFERYWRSLDAGYKGTGLGLAIARGIVLAHGGRIWVDSELTHGAKFCFTLPLEPAQG